jgi:hypothetical protein
MTPNELEKREEHGEHRLTTADLVAANGTPGGSTLAAAKAAQEPNVPLFVPSDTQDFRSRWERIQSGFVDEPRTAVVKADELVANAIKRLAEVFATERHNMEAEWDKTDNVSTEDLRIALRRYRSFFDRLLSV